jgi:heme/copper-type cytochrome/quinol oxidase subunit 1
MGVAGASDAHYVFNVGTLVACIGAVVFVLFVALSALKQRKNATANGG